MSQQATQGTIVSPPEVRQVVLYKHGIGYFALQARVRGTAMLRMQFKAGEMDDALKSLLAADLSGDGFISTISYDAAQDVGKVLADLSVSLPGGTSLLEDFLSDVAGASVELDVHGGTIAGTIVGVDRAEHVQAGPVPAIENVPEIVVMEASTAATRRVPFREITGLRILNQDLRKDLEFYLDAIISTKQKDTKNISIHCVATGDAGGERDIHVSHIQEVPAWKTSYRLVLPGEAAPSDRKDKATLHGFGLVENQTPADWNGVALTLVAGLPVTFRYPIFEPQHVTRKVVPLPSKATIGPTAIEDSFGAFEPQDMASGSRAMAPSPARGMISREKGMDEGEAFARMAESIKQSVSVSTKDAGELFQYRIGRPVTIERNRSALVPILSEQVSARKVLLYDSASHPTNPFACAEITNTSGLVLESGPATIAIDDSLAGEAMLPFLNKDETRMLSYALEQAVVVRLEEKHEQTSVHRVSARNGMFYEHKYEVRKTTCKITNKASTSKFLYVDLPKVAGFTVVESPVEPKDTANRWRFGIDLAPKQDKRVDIVIRKEIHESFTLANADATFLDTRFSVHVTNGLIKPGIKATIEQIVDVNRQRAANQKKVRDLDAERVMLDADQARQRENLKVLGTARAEAELRDRLVKKLAGQEARYEEIKREIVRLKGEDEALKAKIAALVAGISLS